jgi:ribose transport system permease protein
MTSFVEQARRWLWSGRWLLSFVATFALWLVISLKYNQGNGSALGVLTAALALGVPYVLSGLGELFVIAGGNGNIDLSVPYTMTLAAYVAGGRGGVGGLLLGIVLALAVGAAAGIANGVLVVGMKVPPIVATLGSGYLLESAAEIFSNGAPTAPNSYLVSFVTAKVDGVPVMALVFVLVSAMFAFVLRRGVYGRSLLAFGQSARAAWYCGVRGGRVVITSYLLSGLLAAAAGVVLGAYSGGATLDMATAFQLGAIAVVVLGGTPITGGEASVTGVWGGALFVVMLAALLNDTGLSGGWQQVLQGAVVIAVVTLFGRGRAAAT